VSIALFAAEQIHTLELFDFYVSKNALGQLVQLFCCHFRHWSGEHLFWDLGMFALLGAICERISRCGMLVAVVGSICLIPPLVGIFHSSVLTYRGLSGLDTALFGMAVVYLALAKLRDRDHGEALIYFGLLIGMLLKICHELIFGTVFVESNNFLPVPAAHIVGAVIGIVVGVVQYWLIKGEGNSALTDCSRFHRPI
jgi:hypothetical protein